VDLLAITLNAIKGNWRLYHARKRNTKFLALKKRVLERDSNTCRYCGFFSKEYQEILNIDQNYRNNSFDNLATACSFCAQCFFLDSIGYDGNSGGVMIYLPEISQADLNNFSRVLYCSLDKESAYKAKLQSVYLSFKDRNKDIVNCFGPESDDPRVFGQGIIDAKISQELLQHEVMNHIRLLPSRSAFAKQIDYWKKTVFAKVPL
jgi:intracellular multiplication protein IcmJ